MGGRMNRQLQADIYHIQLFACRHGICFFSYGGKDSHSLTKDHLGLGIAVWVRKERMQATLSSWACAGTYNAQGLIEGHVLGIM